jgi:hypothetical protein
MRRIKTIHPLLLTITALAFLGLACSVGGSTSGTEAGAPANDQSSTMQAMQATNDALAAKITESGGGGSKNTPKPAGSTEAAGNPEPTKEAGGSVTDDFSKGSDNWALPKSGATIADGALTVGPYDNSQAMFIIDSDNQSQTVMNAATFAICKACGIAQDYTMSVDVEWVPDSNSDRWLMIVLRFDDKNDNNIADLGKDYVLGLGLMPAGGQNYSAWEFVPFDRNQPWHRTFENAGPIQYKISTNIKIVSLDGGMKFDIYADGKKFSTWVERKSDVVTDERLLWTQLSGGKFAPPSRMSPIITKGKVGLGVMEKGGAAKFSNFSFEPQ